MADPSIPNPQHNSFDPYQQPFSLPPGHAAIALRFRSESRPFYAHLDLRDTCMPTNQATRTTR